MHGAGLHTSIIRIDHSVVKITIVIVDVALELVDSPVFGYVLRFVIRGAILAGVAGE